VTHRPASRLAILLIAVPLALAPGSVAAARSSAAIGPTQSMEPCAPVIQVASPSGSAVPAAASTVTVAAASDLRYAMDDLITTYESMHPEESIEVTYGSSGNFFAQISQGAPFDVYFSADIEYPRQLEAAGLATPDSTRLYAEGRIVVWVRDASPIDVTQGVTAVLDPAAQTVAIANPGHAPYGRAAQAAMESAGVWDAVGPKLVLGENISQAAQFVESGAADVGIIALSLAIAPPLCAEGRSMLVPQELHPPIDQGALVLSAARDPAAAAAFLDFVLGPDGRTVLDGYGFLLPEG
jgi:molybdate transport system substrate-binding protein